MKQTLYTYVKVFLGAAPEVLGWWRAQSKEGFRKTAEEILATAIDFVETNANDLQKSSENGISCVLIEFFNRYGIRASREQNSRGHVDIFICHTCVPGLSLCGEAKVWDGAVNHVKGLDQVLDYATGRFPHCFVLAYIKSGQIESHMNSLRQHLDETLPEAQQGPCTNHDSMDWALLSNHLHKSSGRIVHVLHAGVNLASKGSAI